jgi:maltose O-acetyltransferase
MSRDRVRHLARLVLLNTIASAFWLPPRLRGAVYRACGVRIGAHVFISPGSVIRPGDVRIGAGCFLNYGCILDPGSASIRIGDRVALGPRVTLVGSSHEIGPTESRAGRRVSGDIEIGDGGWLGAGVVVMPGVTIAPGCVIGAGSVVTKDTTPNGLYVGTPARRVRTLSGQPVSSGSSGAR